MRKVSFSEPSEHTAYIGSGAVSALAEAVSGLSHGAAAVVTDSGVPQAHVKKAIAAVKAAGLQPALFTMPCGERHKTLAAVEEIYGFLYDNGFKRSDCVIAVGGGVPGDTAGFAAATYMRGLAFYNVPTTLIAQTDSAYGGKTGVDFRHGKNHVGCFYAPRAVVCDTDFLATLPEEQRLCGMGEVIKYGAIADPDLLESVTANGSRLPGEDTIVRCALIKKRFVEGDAFDLGERRMLNFGHTFGHAVEEAEDYAVPHGQAVAYGMLAAARLGERLGVTGGQVYPAIMEAVRAVGLDAAWQAHARAALPFIGRDKKAGAEGISFVLLKALGHPFCMRLTEDETARLLGFDCNEQE